MSRFHGLPFVDHVPYVTLYTIERWAAMGTVGRLALAFFWRTCISSVADMPLHSGAATLS